MGMDINSKRAFGGIQQKAIKTVNNFFENKL